jgi:hypothetical protein
VLRIGLNGSDLPDRQMRTDQTHSGFVGTIEKRILGLLASNRECRCAGVVVARGIGVD